MCSRLTKGGRVAVQLLNSQMSLLQLGPRFGPTVHAPARGLPDAAVQRVPVSAPAVPGLGGAVQSRCQTLTTTFELSVSNWFAFAPQDYRNLSQLPNFSFSAALCHFCLSQQEDGDHEERNTHRHKADQLLQNTLIMFPGGPFYGVAAPTLTCSHLLLYFWHVLIELIAHPHVESNHLVNVSDTVLMPLLDLCSVQPDARVTTHTYFGPKSQIG